MLGDEVETAHLRSLPSASNRLRLFQIDLLDPDSILAAIRSVSGRELLDPAVTGALNVLHATKESGVRRVVITSLISAIVPILDGQQIGSRTRATRLTLIIVGRKRQSVAFLVKDFDINQMTRSGGFSLGGTFQSSLQQQPLHTTTTHSGELPFATRNTQDLRSHGSDFFPSHGNYHSQIQNIGDPSIGLRPLNSPTPASGLTSLSLGIDLTTVGLSLSSTDSLYKTFGSPWSDEPAKGELEDCSPTCYYAKTPPPLHVVNEHDSIGRWLLFTKWYGEESVKKDRGMNDHPNVKWSEEESSCSVNAAQQLDEAP
ncbi:hypothetical protein ZIOFF_041777 [Zingiber officinale]|uniref:Uncharacterized protein n=1 Tax=Zingiber officinale TaxID=94328 RepID=A0A8J5KWE6_ZINOF|nr:hypothetical protein ZIOFF_041777 [Zingiber officinale]